MRYWELIANGLKGRGWSVGWLKFVYTDDGRPMWSADALSADGKRVIVQAEDLTIAFLELESQCRELGKDEIRFRLAN